MVEYYSIVESVSVVPVPDDPNKVNAHERPMQNITAITATPHAPAGMAAVGAVSSSSFVSGPFYLDTATKSGEFVPSKVWAA